MVSYDYGKFHFTISQFNQYSEKQQNCSNAKKRLKVFSAGAYRQGRTQEFKQGGAKLDRARSARNFFFATPAKLLRTPPHIGQQQIEFQKISEKKVYLSGKKEQNQYEQLIVDQYTVQTYDLSYLEKAVIVKSLIKKIFFAQMCAFYFSKTR